MRTPQVKYDIDGVGRTFIGKVTGGSLQDLMIGSEICVAAGLASRQVKLRGGVVIITVQATTDLRSRLMALSETSDEVSPA